MRFEKKMLKSIFWLSCTISTFSRESSLLFRCSNDRLVLCVTYVILKPLRCVSIINLLFSLTSLTFSLMLPLLFKTSTQPAKNAKTNTSDTINPPWCWPYYLALQQTYHRRVHTMNYPQFTAAYLTTLANQETCYASIFTADLRVQCVLGASWWCWLL